MENDHTNPTPLFPETRIERLKRKGIVKSPKIEEVEGLNGSTLLRRSKKDKGLQVLRLRASQQVSPLGIMPGASKGATPNGSRRGRGVSRKRDSLGADAPPVRIDASTPADNAQLPFCHGAIIPANLLNSVNSSVGISNETSFHESTVRISNNGASNADAPTHHAALQRSYSTAAKYAPAAPDEILLLEQVRRWRTDIISFAKNALFLVPTLQQEEVLLAVQKPGSKVTVRAGHGVGKTTSEAVCAIWHVLLFTNSKTAATAPSANQLRDVLMAEIGRILQNCHPWIKAQLTISNMRLEVVGKESSQFLTARTARPEQPDALQGLHAENMMFIVDEAFGVADSVFEVARGALSTEGARVILCGNPTATSGYAYNTHNRNKELWTCIVLNAELSPLVSKASIEEWEKEYGKDSDEYRVRVQGEFPRASICQLIPRALAEESTLRKIAVGQYIFAPTVLGVDVAWEGDDRSVIFLRQGLMSQKLWEGRNVDSITLGNLVRQYWDEYHCEGVFIDVGWGTGVIDYLRSLGRNPIAVNFGSSSSSMEYANKRTEMWCELRKWLDSGGVLPREESLLDDLTGPNYSFLGSGKKMLEPKKMMKKRGLKSPDLGDALALTFAAPVVKRSEIEAYRDNLNVCVTDFDIYS